MAFEDDRMLPVITNQKMNDYLKELAELADIDEPVRQTYYRRPLKNKEVEGRGVLRIKGASERGGSKE